MTDEPIAAPAPEAAPIAVAAPAAPPPATPTPEPVVLPKRRSRWLDLVLGFAVVVAVGGIAFGVGRLTAPTASAFGANGQGRTFTGGRGPNASLAPGETPGPGFRGGFGGALSLQGTVTEIAADHISIKLDSGQTVQVPLDTSTAYHRETAAGSSDVKADTRVVVRFQPGGAGGVRTGQLPTASDVTIVGQ
jgi:hypothetical protein